MKSFIIHIDSLEILESLNNEQAGKLFKAIKQYQEDQTIIEEDQLIKVALSPFVSQFKRDKEKYDNICKRNRENGKNGGRPKTEETQNNPVGYLETQENPKNLKNKNKNKSNNNSNNKPIVQKENPFADMTKEFLQDRYKQMERNKAITQKDFDNIRKLIEIDLKNRDNPVDDVQRAMDCVNENSDKEYFPIIESSKAFREKFTKIESYMKRNGISNQQNSISKEEDKKRRLKAINEIAGQELFSSLRQLQSNDTTVFLFMKNDDDEKALRSLPEEKKEKIKGILSDMLTNKKLEVQIAGFHLN